MPNITEEKWIEMLEKKADGTYIIKYPKVKSKSGITFDEHLADDVKHITAEERAKWDAKIDETDKGQPNGVAPLDENGRLPMALLTPVSIVPSDEILKEFSHTFTREEVPPNTDAYIGSFRIGHGGLYRINADFQTSYKTGDTYFYFDYGTVRLSTIRIASGNQGVYINISTDFKEGVPSGAIVTIKARADVKFDVRIRNLKLLGTYGTPDMEVLD